MTETKQAPLTDEELSEWSTTVTGFGGGVHIDRNVLARIVSELRALREQLRELGARLDFMRGRPGHRQALCSQRERPPTRHRTWSMAAMTQGPLTDEELWALESLSVSGSPGEWEVREHEGQVAICHPRGWVMEGEDGSEGDARDARLIVEMRNALPRLLAELRALRAEKADRIDGCSHETRLVETGACVNCGSLR